VPEFPCQRYHGNIIVVFEFGIECENICDIVLSVSAAINRQTPFVSFYVIPIFVVFRLGA
jgi:hypothetical protein